jgi:predicted neuraminidase
MVIINVKSALDAWWKLASIFSGGMLGLFLLGLIMLFSACQSKTAPEGKAMEIPKLAVEGENGYVSGKFIYPLDDRPTPECHASTMAEIQGGVIAAWFGGQHEKNPDVGIWVSRYENGSWTKPVEVADGVQSDTLRYPCWNPVLFRPVSGPLMLFYKVGPDPRRWWGMLKTSRDGGKTWSEASKLGMGPLGHLIGPVKNKPVQLEDGSILCPSSTEVRESGKDDVWMVHFELTKDLGQTWQVTGPINDGQKFDAIQPSILFYRGGKMQILCRTQQGVISQSWSEDHGSTWTEMAATSLPNPNAGTDAVTLEDGRQLLVYNHTLRKGDFPSGRNMINVAVSRNGTDWNPVLTLEKAKGEFSYPAVIQASDGLVHISYTYLRRTIKHIVVDPEKLH